MPDEHSGNLGRRRFLVAGAAGISGVIAGGGTAAARPAPCDPATVYLGSFTSWGSPPGPGLQVGAVDPATGRLTVTATAGLADPSFFAFSADRRILYTTNETATGEVTALSVADPRRPVVLNTQPTGGGGPTHLSVHPSGRYLLTANYTAGSVAVHGLAADGRIGARTDLVRHTGQTREPHAHQVLPDPSGRWVLAVDLGADSVYVYGLDLAGGRLRLNQQLKLPVGAGPRHLAFHPGGRYAYVLGELRSEITVAAWDPAAGRLTPGQVVGTLGDAKPEQNHPAEIQVSPDGRFVYASNRGHDSLAAFAVQGGGGRLAFLATAPTGGKWPRHFTLDPAGTRVYVANQNSNTVTWLPRNPATGRLGSPAGATTVNTVGIVLFH